MRWVKTRVKFVSEAKIRDLLFKKQADAVKDKWGEKYLEYEEVFPNENLKQGKWKLDDEEKNLVLDQFFQVQIAEIYKIFSSVPEKFADILSQSIDLTVLTDPYKTILKEFTIKKPTIDQICILHDNVFRKLSTNETKAEEIISKDENGRPILDESGKPTKVPKVKGDPIFSKNLVNITAFVAEYNRCYSTEMITSNFEHSSIHRIRNYSKENFNADYKFDFEIFNKDLYLSISHNPKDILNISISKFFASCQHLYTGSHRGHLLGNVFDPNSVPAYLVFDTPIFWNEEKISEQLPLCRAFIRSFDSYESTSSQIFYDKCYPDRLEAILYTMIDKYTGMKSTVRSGSVNYVWTPDLPDDDKLGYPYMDRLGIERGTYIGSNVKSLCLSRITNWSHVRISPKNSIKELVIETETLPENIFKVKFNLDWVKFKFMKINDLSKFEKLSYNSIAFEKCKFDGSLLKNISNIKSIQLNSCDVDNLNLSLLGEIDEIQLLYTLEVGEKLKDVLGSLKFKSIVISGDTLSDKENKEYIRLLKSQKVKVKIVGPII